MAIPPLSPSIESIPKQDSTQYSTGILKAGSYVLPPERHTTDMDKMLYRVFCLLIDREHDNATLLKKVVTRELSLRDELCKQMEQLTNEEANSKGVSNFFTKFSNLLFPLALVGEGIASVAVKGPDPVAITSIAFGGLVIIDQLFNDAGKKVASSLLGKLSGESDAEWLGRISTSTTVLTMGLSFGVEGGKALSIASGVTNLALQTGKAGSDFYLHNKQADLLLHEIEWDFSSDRLQKHLEKITATSQFHGHLYELLENWQTSTKETVAQIFT